MIGLPVAFFYSSLRLDKMHVLQRRICLRSAFLTAMMIVVSGEREVMSLIRSEEVYYPALEPDKAPRHLRKKSQAFCKADFPFQEMAILRPKDELHITRGSQNDGEQSEPVSSLTCIVRQTADCGG